MPNDISEPYSYPQNDADHKEIPSSTPLEIYHAPFSLLHIDSKPTDYSIPINLNSSGTYYIPKTNEILGSQLSDDLASNISQLTPSQQETIIAKYKQFHQEDNLYGEYLPQTYSKPPYEFNNTKIETGNSLDPIKYITNLLVQRSIEHPNKQQEIVLHPDIIYFASKGQIENIPNVLSYLNSIALTLNQKVFFENLTFSNEKFKEALGIFENPINIFNMVRNFSQMGVVVDINHLEKSHGNFEIINQIPPQKLIIHARKGYHENYSDLYRYCIMNAIPWVIE